ncbi:MAG: TIGR03862 family flavoprotein [Paracoccaceae bacterium]
MSPPPTALVVGAGPAGLMAAETLAARGAAVTVAEAMPSPARKFLMAGKSGLNLTHDAPPARIAEACAEAAPWLAHALDAFGPAAIRDWAEGLGQPLFTGSSGRVFPRAMKASPLLRAWLARLDALGVRLLRRHRLVAFEGEGAPPECRFETPDGAVTLRAGAVVLALGGASWARLGSDGRWTAALAARGIESARFRPANVALSVAWSAHMTAHFGAPLKPLRLSAGAFSARGEATISARGLEGGGVYAVSRGFRDGAPLILDLAPDLTEGAAAARLGKARRGDSVARRLAKALGLDPAKRALLQELARPLPQDPAALAAIVKALRVPGVPRPLDEAISTGGGLPRTALDEAYELRALPGVFAAGEMLDWEAPTGGHLLTACLATGRAAGAAAADRLGLPGD